MSSDFVISSLLLIAAFTCRGVIATCNMTSEPATICSMDRGPLKKLFLPVDGSFGECRCNVELVDIDQSIQQTIIQFTNHMISKPNCPYKITFKDYSYTIRCEKSEALSIPVNKTKPTVVFFVTKDSSLTDSTTTGGFCLNMTILQGKFNISCRPTSISSTTETDLTTSTESTVLDTDKDPSITGEDEPIKEFPVAAVAGGITGGVVIIIIIIIVFICFFKKRQRNYDKPLSRTREDDYNYQNMQNESSENNQEAHQDQHSPAAEASSDVIVLENDMYVSYDDSRLIGKPPASNYEGIQNIPSDKTTNANDRNERTSSGLYTTCDVGSDLTPASKSRSGYETVDDQLFNANVGHPPKKFAPVTPDVNDNVYTLVNKKPGKKLESDENTEAEKAPDTEFPDLGEPGLEINEKGENVVYAVSTKPRTEQQEDAARGREEDLANMYAVVDKNRGPEPDKANNQKPPIPIKPVRL